VAGGAARGLASRTYRPDPVGGRPSRSLGGGKRPLGIPTIRDRVVKAAAKIVLEPILEPVRELNESMESLMIQGSGPNHLGGRRCGPTKIALATTAMDCAIPAI